MLTDGLYLRREVILQRMGYDVRKTGRDTLSEVVTRIWATSFAVAAFLDI